MKIILYILIIGASISVANSGSLAQKPDPKAPPSVQVAPASGAGRAVPVESKREALNKRLEERKFELAKEKTEHPKPVTVHPSAAADKKAVKK